MVKAHSYIAQYPVRWTAQSALHFTPWQTCSFRHQLNFCGKHSDILHIYSQVLIQMCELRQLEWNSSFKIAEKSEFTRIIRQVVTNCRLLTAHILKAYFFQKSTCWMQKNIQLLVVIMLCFLKFSLPLTHTTKKHLDHS